MLTVEPIIEGRRERGGVWQEHALILDGATVARISLHPSNRRGVTEPSIIAFDDCSYEARIVDRGKPRWTFEPARWVLCHGESELYGAERRDAGAFRIDAPGTAPPLDFRRAHWGVNFTLSAADGGERWGGATVVRQRLLPKLRLQHYALAFERRLPLTFQAFLAWIVVQVALDESDG